MSLEDSVTKINLDQSSGKAKVWRKKEKKTSQDPKHKHCGEPVMAWACMTAPGTGSLFFIDDETHDGSRSLQ